MNRFVVMVRVIIVGVYILLLLAAPSVLYAQEPLYDLNKIRLKIFHLLNFSPADHSLVPMPGGRMITPTPTAVRGGPTTIATRIFFIENSVENTIGAGSFTTALGYRIQITRQIPIRNKSVPAHRYYLWLVRTTSNPAVSQLLSTFDTAVIPSIDRTFPTNLTDYDQLIATEEDPTRNPTSPTLDAPLFTAQQVVIVATPTPGAGTPANPTPTGSAPTPTPVGGAGNLEKNQTVFHQLMELLGF